MSNIVARSFQTEAAPYTLPNDASEWERLDDLHNGWKAYLDHKLSYAPLVENAEQILEIGAGSGAWAIQAAETYPNATVVATDISPLPPRPLPPNVRFQKVNIIEKELPFKPGTFDIIHARLLFIHLPDWEDILERVITLLKPGGWLLVEDVDHFVFEESGNVPPGTQEFFDVYNAYNVAQKVDPMAGSKLAPALRRTNQFSKVNAVEIHCPFRGGSKDPNLNAVGRVMESSLRRVYQAVKPELVTAGLTAELQRRLIEEVDDPEVGSLYMKFYMTWSMKT
ncbi:hypothetical protein DXG03_001899 [Asterophora parasitica]|uniref:S-adenosyl-L-methionine-dependent methyltransferase n=1 Tax=Asterophora parasitica TaxID=117018 RepID=A0A9P7G905_9AGAR|nr:hypothetical protein DXG03_001899 [Asterophora parasitica]